SLGLIRIYLISFFFSAVKRNRAAAQTGISSFAQRLLDSGVLSLEIVSDPPLGMDILGITGHCLDLFSQASDMHVYSPHISRILISPNQIQQVFSAVYFIRVLRQKL